MQSDKEIIEQKLKEELEPVFQKVSPLQDTINKLKWSRRKR